MSRGSGGIAFLPKTIKTTKLPLMSQETSSNLMKWRESLTPEQREALAQKTAEARSRKAKEKREKLEAAKRAAEALLPHVLAEQMKNEIEGKDFKPSPETINRLRALVDKGLTLKQLKDDYFKDVDNVVWQKIVRFLFQDQVANAEDLALRLIESQKRLLKELGKQLKDIKKQKREQMKQKKDISGLSRLQLQLTEKIFQLQVNVNEAMLNLGVVGEKQKAASINIHMSVPRPEKKIKDVGVIEV